MTAFLFVTLLATAAIPQGSAGLRPMAAPDSLGPVGSFGAVGAPSPPGPQLFSGFS